MPCVAVQLLDEVRAWGFHAYDFETYLADLSDEATEVVAEHLPRKNSPLSVLVQHELEETGMRLRDLWARRPAVADGSVHHVQAVSSRVIPSPRRAARPHEAGCYYILYYSARHAKGPLPAGKGP
jgi:hypothetical protein